MPNDPHICGLYGFVYLAIWYCLRLPLILQKKKITMIYKNVKQVLLSLEVKKGCGLENSILPMFVQKYSWLISHHPILGLKTNWDLKNLSNM